MLLLITLKRTEDGNCRRFTRSAIENDIPRARHRIVDSGAIVGRKSADATVESMLHSAERRCMTGAYRFTACLCIAHARLYIQRGLKLQRESMLVLARLFAARVSERAFFLRANLKRRASNAVLGGRFGILRSACR